MRFPACVATNMTIAASDPVHIAHIGPEVSWPSKACHGTCIAAPAPQSPELSHVGRAKHGAGTAGAAGQFGPSGDERVQADGCGRF